MRGRLLKGRFNNEQEHKIGLVVYQPIPDFYFDFFPASITLVLLACSNELEYDLAYS